jgi:predicted MFS family arabinose efflux permease
MTSLSHSATLVALVQTATSLPFLVAALPAGMLGDMVDRRWILVAMLGWTTAVALAIGLTTLLGAMTSWFLLALTFALGMGYAAMLPTWQAVLPSLVSRSELPQAVTLVGVNVNASRAVGPAVGGLLIAAAGPGAAFLINAVLFFVALCVVFRWEGSRHHDARPERFRGALWAGLRFARNEPALRAVLVRAALFMVGGSGVLALLPLVARQQLGLGSDGYGLLLGCFGLGAVIGATLMSQLRRRASRNRIVAGASVVLAATTFVLAFVPDPILAGLVLLGGGAAWLSAMANLNTTAQTLLPAWVRARGLSLYVLTFQTCLAAGSAVWGIAAEGLSVRIALMVAAVWLVASLGAIRRWPLADGEGSDLTSSLHYWPEPVVVDEPGAEEGPVLVTLEYRIDPENSQEFDRAIQKLGRIRRRDGASYWGIFRDVADPGRRLETFLVESWSEHMRQHARLTEADRDIEDTVRAFHLGEGPPAVSHLVAEHLPKSREGRIAHVREAVADSIGHYRRRQENI